MRAHEVPTHVQAEDKALLWFTFPQVAAMTAVCALAYGVHRYAPFGPTEARTILAVLLALAGLVLIAGRINGRALPLVAADVLRFRLGPRRYAGTAAQFLAGAPPAPAQTGPGPALLMARRARRALRRLRMKPRKGRGERRNGRLPLRRGSWLRRRERRERFDEGDAAAVRHEARRNAPRRSALGAAVMAAGLLAAVAAAPSASAETLNDGGWNDERWSSPEIDFGPPEQVDGRRLYLEGLTVTAAGASVTLRAAADIDVRVQAHGGSEGSDLRFWGTASLEQGEQASYDLPLDGPAPSLTFSWEDELGQAGAFTLRGEQLPYPLPAAEGRLCRAAVASLGWSPDAVSGVIASGCADAVEEKVDLRTVSGHADVTQTALMDAAVASVTGTVSVSAGEASVSVPFVPDGETGFRLPVEPGRGVYGLTIDLDLTASLRIPLPPLTELTHHPERTEPYTETVQLLRPGITKTVSETVTVEHDDGTTTEHVVSATLSIPDAVVSKDVTVHVVQPERVEAEVTARQPMTRSLAETLALRGSVWADDAFEELILPEPEPEEELSEQAPADDGLLDWFIERGWEWPW